MIHKNKLALSALALCFAVLPIMLSCSNDENEPVEDNIINYDLTVSDNSFTFPIEGGEFVLTINTNYVDSWTTDFQNNEWLTEVNRTKNTLTISAAANESDDVLQHSFTVTAGEITRTVTLSQDFKAEKKTANFFLVPHSGFIVSADAHYICTHSQAENGHVTIYVTDTQTDEIETIGSSPNITEIVAISNNKVAVGSTSFGGFYAKDGDIIQLDTPEGFNSVTVTDVNGDGTIIVGYAVKAEDNKYYALRWDNGTPTVMPFEPTQARVAINAVTGIMAEAISPDGNYIVGRLFTGQASEGIYWKDGVVDYMGDIVEKEIPNIMGGTSIVKYVCPNGPGLAMLFSANSRYFAGIFQTYGMGLMGKGTVTVPALFDFETEEFTEIFDYIIDEQNNGGARPRGVTDEGYLSYSLIIRAGGGEIQSFMRMNGESVDMSEYLAAEFGFYMAEKITVLKYIEGQTVIGSYYSTADVVPVEIGFYARPIDK